jgi:hypothetical protein
MSRASARFQASFALGVLALALDISGGSWPRAAVIAALLLAAIAVTKP